VSKGRRASKPGTSLVHCAIKGATDVVLSTVFPNVQRLIDAMQAKSGADAATVAKHADNIQATVNLLPRDTQPRRRNRLAEARQSAAAVRPLPPPLPRAPTEARVNPDADSDDGCE
jgi:membrane-bound lytic murein transglycosylase B